MKFCRFCGSQLPARSVKFCPKCGKNINVQQNAQAQTAPSTTPTKKIKEKYIQPQQLRQQKQHRPQTQRRVIKSQQEIRIKPEIVEVEISNDQRLVLYNQRIKASLERLIDSNKNLERRESYQLADHSNLTLMLDELFNFRRESIFKNSDYVEATNEVIDETYTVLIRVSEFLTSHLKTYKLDKIRAQWYSLKEKQSHLELDRNRLLKLNKLSEKMEKNFNILAYRLDNAQPIKMKRSTFFAAFPQVHHYYFGELDKGIPIYREQIHEGGFHRYYNSEIRVLSVIQDYFNAREYSVVDPREVYLSCVEYLERRNKVAEKLEVKLTETQRQIITNQDLFRDLRIKYVDVMEDVIEKTPHDVLLMTETTEVASGIDDRESVYSEADTLYIESLQEFSQTGKLATLKDLSGLEEFNNPKKLDGLDQLGDTKNLDQFSNVSE